MPTAEKTRTALHLRCSIRRDIVAPPERIWKLLTDAARFPSWNSTVTRIDGEIALGAKLALRVPLDPKRTFHPKVTRLVANREMEWRDGFAPMFRGIRTFALTPGATGVTTFEMTETFSGLMLPMIAKSLPDFGPAFETYAADLARAAEKEPR